MRGLRGKTGTVKCSRRLAQVLAAVCATVLFTTTLASCGDPAEITTLQVDVLLESVAKKLHKIGPSDRSLYGSNHLIGVGTMGDEKVDVEMQATVDYTAGSGEINGFITFTFDDGSVIGVRMVNGSAVAKTDTTSARFFSLLSVIDGTDGYIGIQGRGTFTGERIDAIGGAVQSRFVLRVER